MYSTYKGTELNKKSTVLYASKTNFAVSKISKKVKQSTNPVIFRIKFFFFNFDKKNFKILSQSNNLLTHITLSNF